MHIKKTHQYCHGMAWHAFRHSEYLLKYLCIQRQSGAQRKGACDWMLCTSSGTENSEGKWSSNQRIIFRQLFDIQLGFWLIARAFIRLLKIIPWIFWFKSSREMSVRAGLSLLFNPFESYCCCCCKCFYFLVLLFHFIYFLFLRDDLNSIEQICVRLFKIH